MDSLEQAALLLTKLSAVRERGRQVPQKPSSAISEPLKRLATQSSTTTDDNEGRRTVTPIPTPTVMSPVSSSCTLLLLPQSLQALPPPPRLGMENPSILQPLRHTLRSKNYTPPEDDCCSMMNNENASPHRRKQQQQQVPRRHNFVGETTSQKIRAVLKQKFSWKKFPELEEFLVSHREEYFRHASEHNYTRKQRDFNNSLTDSLLKYASELGYVFEGFTFVMLRDRIRCYYKSYLQCLRERVKRQDNVPQPKSQDRAEGGKCDGKGN